MNVYLEAWYGGVMPNPVADGCGADMDEALS